MQGVKRGTDHADIKNRMTWISLRRALLASFASLLSVSAMTLSLSISGHLGSAQLIFAGANLFINVVRAITGFSIRPMSSENVSRFILTIYRIQTHLVNVTWMLLAYSIYDANGLQSDNSIFCLLITSAMMANTQMSFAGILDLSIGTIATLGLSTAVIMGMLGASNVDYFIATLSVVFSILMAYNALKTYKLLFMFEQQLSAQRGENKLMNSLLNAVPGFMTLLDSELRYVLVNDEFQNYTKRDMIGKTLGSIDHDQAFHDLVERFMVSNKSKDLMEVRFGPLLHGEHYLVSMVKITTGPEMLIAVMSLSIEEQKKTEQELSKARSDAEHAGRLATLGEMISSVAHEIRNPLAIISARAAAMAKQATKEPLTLERVNEDSQKTVAMVDRIMKIIQTVLKFSRGEANEPMVTTPVKQLLEEAIFLTAIKCKTSNVTLRESGLSELQAISCHPVQIGQVLVNLINNAVDALEGKDNKWIEVNIREVGERLQLRIIDSGLGIPPEIRARLLEPFFTTKPAGKGTGLGLSISRGIIEKHQGALTIDADAPNTTFVIDLPKFQAVAGGLKLAS